jgi:DsbC/DsbD-like thiol-disulfide interchange protein
MNTSSYRTPFTVLSAAAIYLCAVGATATAASPQALIKASTSAPHGPAVATAAAEDVQAAIAVSPATAAPGDRLEVKIKLQIAPGWHIYGQPLPDNYVPTTLTFDKELLSNQSVELPKATPVNFKGLGETLPVYQGVVNATGTIVLKDGLKPGSYRIGGELKFQECNDMICKMPQALKFEVPITVAAR